MVILLLLYEAKIVDLSEVFSRIVLFIWIIFSVYSNSKNVPLLARIDKNWVLSIEAKLDYSKYKIPPNIVTVILKTELLLNQTELFV